MGRPLRFTPVFSYSFVLLFSWPIVSSRRFDVYNTSTHRVAFVRIYNAGLKCAARGSLEIQDAKICHLRTVAQRCRAIFATKLFTMFGCLLGWYTKHFRELLPFNGILLGAKFTLRPSLAFSCIGSVTALLSSSGRQPNCGVVQGMELRDFRCSSEGPNGILPAGNILGKWKN